MIQRDTTYQRLYYSRPNQDSKAGHQTTFCVTNHTDSYFLLRFSILALDPGIRTHCFSFTTERYGMWGLSAHNTFMDPLFHTKPFSIQWRPVWKHMCVSERVSSLPDVCCAAAVTVHWFINPGWLTTRNFPLHVQLGFTLTGQGKFFSVTLPFFPFLLLGQASSSLMNGMSRELCPYTSVSEHIFTLVALSLEL